MLRKIEQRRWYKGTFPWLVQNEIPADPLADLKTSQNNLSVFYINEDLSNLTDVITAYAATRDYAVNFDCLLFDEQICSELNIEIKETKGTTCDEEVNIKWHRDLTKLSADKLLELAKVIYQKGKQCRKSEKEITEMVARASRAGRIPIKDLKEKLRQRVIATPIWKASSPS
jgi:hypothetical protein